MTSSLSLSGTWKLWWYDGMRGRTDYRAFDAVERRRAIDARVPGEVHLDAWRAGWIADPYVGTNVLKARWVEEMIWIYRRWFSAPAAALNGRAWLSFEGLDLDAVIRLNGKEVGRHRNAFYPCRVEITGALRSGRNELTVQVESGIFSGGRKPIDGLATRPDDPLHRRPWQRKSQSQFAWDWSPRLVNVGIHGPVALEWTSDPARVDRIVPLAGVSADLKRGTVRCRLFVEGLGKKEIAGRLAVEILEAGVRAEAPVRIVPGLHAVEAAVEVANPKLWWPVGHGGQPRYTVRASLEVEGKRVGEKSARIGFRRVEVSQKPHPATGRHFVIEVNNKPVFAKGGNLVPADMINFRIDARRSAVLVDRALEANFNMLRVWGGGIYESDEFYDICDEKGILVWQEFIYACAKYPMNDEAFYEDAKREAVHQIRRLARHPSLIVWCGNNEMEAANWDWGYDRGVVYPDHAFFHLTLPRLLKEEDPTRFYQPSSPFSPGGENPSRDDVGDQHPWSIGFGDNDFRKYRDMICRFPNEGGMMGPTALPTVKACLEKGMEYVSSLAWETHENSITYWGDRKPQNVMLEEWLGKRIEKMSLADYVFYGGIVQGEGLNEYIKNFRRRMFDTSSAVFWMYNDTWPAVRSWTIVDYYLRRTPSFHPVRRAFLPRTVVVTREDDRVRVFGVNEGDGWSGSLRYGILALAGGYPVDATKEVSLPANSSTLVAELDAKAWDRLGVKTHMAFAMLLEGDREIARDRMIIPLYREMKWPKARVAVRRKGSRVIFTSARYAWRVCLDLNGDDRLPDNFFDVWPGIPTVLDWPKRLPAPKVLRLGNLQGYA